MVKKYRRPTEVRLILPCEKHEIVVDLRVLLEAKLQSLTPQQFPGKVTRVTDDDFYVAMGGLQYEL